MAKKNESEKMRFVKVHAPRVLGIMRGEAVITGKYPTMELAQASPERGRIMPPLQASNFVKNWNKKYHGKKESR